MSMQKIPMAPTGIKPATFRFVAQHLNNCATAVPRTVLIFPSIFRSSNLGNCSETSPPKFCKHWGSLSRKPKPFHSPRFHHPKFRIIKRDYRKLLSLNVLNVPVSTIYVTYSRNAPYACHVTDTVAVFAAAQIFTSTFTISRFAHVQWTGYSMLWVSI